jgi:lipopolysaccharide transport system ATP-binding protein
MIHVRQLSKSFRLYRKPSDRLKEILLRRPCHHNHQALHNISFTLNNGETLGILGQNGAGKSTLLKLLTGVLIPDSGDIQIDGRITGLLELGTGFDHALTGLDNIMANGLLIGMSRAEILAVRERIIEFSELGEYIHEPVRTYSSGMVMRLAFSIAIHASPACFVVDEALSVGDGHFQQKCMRRIRQFRDSGGGIIFVSHDLNAVKMLCDRALVLDGGQIAFAGDAEGAVNHYNRIMARLDEQEARIQARSRRSQSYGTLEAEIIDAHLSGEHSGCDTVAAGERATLSVTLRANVPLEALSVGFMIRDRFGQDIFGTNSFLLGEPLRLNSGERCQTRFTLPLNLAPGKYTLTLALHSQDNHLEHCYHWCDNLVRFEIAGSHLPLFSGIVSLPTQIRHHPL